MARSAVVGQDRSRPAMTRDPPASERHQSPRGSPDGSPRTARPQPRDVLRLALHPAPESEEAMIHCPQCRQPAPLGATFCAFCGVRLPRGGVKRRDVAALDPAASRADLPGERKHVTVLFADVTASMAVLTSHDAEEAAVLFDRVIDHMIEAIRRYEGNVTQVLGDGVMALFGAPVAHEDHAVRACYAALRMQERITAYGDAVQRAHGIPIQIRVGLNSGEVV